MHEPADPKARLAELEEVFTALAHAARRHVLLVVWFRGGTMTAGDIAGRFSHTWPTTSRHLRVLADAGLLTHERQGRTRIYRVNQRKLDAVRAWLRWFTEPTPRIDEEKTMPTVSNIQRNGAALRDIAMTYPGAHEAFPWGETAIKVAGKAFLFMHTSAEALSMSCKLPASHEMALMLPFARATGYGLGKSGWVSASFGPHDEPPIDLLREWIDESYRAIAPKKLAAALAGGGAGEAGNASEAVKRGSAASAGKQASAAKASASKKGSAAKAGKQTSAAKASAGKQASAAKAGAGRKASAAKAGAGRKASAAKASASKTSTAKASTAKAGASKASTAKAATKPRK